MRLDADALKAIREEVSRLDAAAEIYLFGSRADDAAKGGDIDLLVVTDRMDFRGELRLRTRILDRIGWQQLDLLVRRRDQLAEPLAALARERNQIMKPDHVRNLLRQSLTELADARRHLDYSYQQVAALPPTLHGATEKQLESAEAFTGRFARTVDLLVNKVLRGLDRVELKPEGSLLDVINRAEKRGLVAQGVELREMKDVRNMIAHDYAGARAAEIFNYCREQKPVLDGICARVADWAQQILAGESAS